ncbi:MAG: 16S rRNA (cytosine(1402)-N(4))-methyltransferase RsmH [Candidatus Dojkabacteria bacterium]
MISKTEHVSVLLKETVEELCLKANSIIVDATLGGGGHSLGVIDYLESGTLVCIDSDIQAIKSFKTKISDLGFKEIVNSSSVGQAFKRETQTIYLVNSNFQSISETLNALKIGKVNGIIADLGWSSDQMKSVAGLSFSRDETPLDMRLDKKLNVKASDLLNALGKGELEKMLGRYGDFTKVETRILSTAIIQQRKIKPFNVTGDLNNLIEKIQYKLGNRAQRNLNQLKARIYQSLRIAVNVEYENLRQLMIGAEEVLVNGGRLNIITFHSGEEKIVEQSLNDLESLFLEKKILPSVNEIKLNKRSRSAKLWVITKK